MTPVEGVSEARAADILNCTINRAIPLLCPILLFRQSTGGDKRGDPLKSILAASLLFLGSAAQADVSRDASYFCTSEAAGGISYNSPAKQWEGTVFKPTVKFILKMQYQGTKTDELNVQYDLYRVKIADYGQNFSLPCVQLNHDGDIVWYSKEGMLVCTTFANDLRFNPVNLRFLEFYQYGFLDGKDNNDDTPAISGGTCTKIP